jgi:hypothetical protein
MVSGEDESIRSTIVNCHGEHSAQVGENRRVQSHEAEENQFGVAPSAGLQPMTREKFTQLLDVVDLPVVCHGNAPIARCHRLSTRWREVHDGEPRIDELT